VEYNTVFQPLEIVCGMFWVSRSWEIVSQTIFLFARTALTTTENISYSVFGAHHHPSPLSYNEYWLCHLFALFACSSCLLISHVPLEKYSSYKRERNKENLKHFQKVDIAFISFPLPCFVFPLLFCVHPQHAVWLQQWTTAVLFLFWIGTMSNVFSET